MKVLLLQNIKTLGNKGDVKQVSDGYARNFLLPKKLAEAATAEAIKNVEAKRSEEEGKKSESLKEMKELAGKLKNKKITLKSKAKKGKLFGSISAKDIGEALEKEDLKVSRECIIIKEAIKKTGVYNVNVVLSPEVSTSIVLEIKEE
jgi:large subunit ribosomal protein L9